MSSLAREGRRGFLKRPRLAKNRELRLLQLITKPYATRSSGKNMENILEKTVKENGNINLSELSWKQVVALLGAWDSSFARNENTSFSEMVKRCYKSRPWHENANIIYLHRDNKKTTILPHACYNLDEAEENMIFNLLKKQLK